MKSLIWIFYLTFFVFAACSPKKTGTPSKARSIPFSTLDGSGNLSSLGFKSTSEVIGAILTLKSTILDRRAKMDAEKNYRSNLMQDLIANIGAGCMSNIAVNTIDIIASGQKLDDVDVSSSMGSNQFLTQADPTQANFTIYLGDLAKKNFITFTNNEIQTPLFINNGRITYHVPADQAIKVSSIEMISISKAGAYSTTSFCPNPENLPVTPKCDSPPTIMETQRYLANSFVIQINGSSFYANQTAQFVFSANKGTEKNIKGVGLLWSDNNPQLNDNYLTFIQNPNCPSN